MIGNAAGPYKELPSEFRSYDGVRIGLGLLQPGTVFLGKGKGQRTGTGTEKTAALVGINGKRCWLVDVVCLM